MIKPSALITALLDEVGQYEGSSGIESIVKNGYNKGDLSVELRSAYEEDTNAARRAIQRMALLRLGEDGAKEEDGLTPSQREELEEVAAEARECGFTGHLPAGDLLECAAVLEEAELEDLADRIHAVR